MSPVAVISPVCCVLRLRPLSLPPNPVAAGYRVCHRVIALSLARRGVSLTFALFSCPVATSAFTGGAFRQLVVKTEVSMTWVDMFGQHMSCLILM